MWTQRDRIVKQPVLKALLLLAMPAVASSMFYVIFEIVDMFWIGKLGSSSVAALSAATFFVWLLRALAQTVAIGTIALISRRAGERDKERLLKTAINAITSTCIFSVGVIVVFFPLSSQIFLWIGIETGVANMAAEYAGVFLAGLFFVYLMVTGEHVLRGMGNTKIPMMITGFSLLLNVVLDPIFIFHFNMGLKGAAYATVLSQLIGCFLMMGALIYFLPDLKKGRLDLSSEFFKDYFFPIVRIGTPISMSNAAFAAIYMVLSGIISFFGSAPLAAIGIGHRIEAFPFFIALGFSMATSAMVGQQLGAGNPEKARDSTFLSLKITCVILFLSSIIFFFFAEELFSFFISDSEVIHYGVQYLKIIAVAEIFLAFEVVLEGAFSGAGNTRPPFLITFPITLLRIPLSYLFGITLGLGLTGIWVVIAATTFFKGNLLFFWFRKGYWTEKKV